MRMPPFERYPIILHGAASFLVGSIVGICLYHAFFFQKIEQIQNVNVRLRAKVESYSSTIHELERYKHKPTVIKSIRPLLENSATTTLPEQTKIQLKQRVKKDLLALQGTSIYDIDTHARLARKWLHDKLYSNIIGQNYAVQLTTMLVVENELYVWFTAVRVDAPPPA